MVPEGWHLGEVADVCRFQNGYGFTPPVWDTVGLPIIRIQNLNGSKNFNYYSGEPDPKWLVEDGQMLFAWAGTKGASFGPTIWRGETGVLNQHIFKVFEAEGVDHSWLHEMLRHITERIEGKAHGFKATLVHVKKSDIERQPVHIPPLPEQRKIADILATWDQAIEKTEALLSNARTQKRALMQQLLTGKRRFPAFAGQPWKEVRLGDLTDLITKGTTPTSVGYEFTDCGVNFIKAENVSDSGHILPAKTFISDECNEALKRSQFQAGDLLVTIAGAIGRIGIVHGENLPANTNQAVAVIRVPASCLIIRRMLFYWLQGDHVQSIFRSSVTTGAQPNINLKQIGNLPIKFPSLAEQSMIVSALDAAAEEVDALVENIAKLRTEKKALMQQLLTGKRRVTT